MNYEEALQFIHGTLKFGSKLGLQNITELLNRLGNPHMAFPSVHVAGTNGKGSVTAMTANILYKAGYKVGMFISPYLERFTERIQVNFQEIPRDDLARLTGLVKTKIGEMVRDGYHHPTEFEVVTALGFLYFAEQKIDIAVVEVGLGGRLDATNVIHPLVSVITSISYDHMDILGNTLKEIAFEKGGIIKPGVPVVSSSQAEEAAKVLEELARKRNAPYYPVFAEQIRERFSSFREQRFDFRYGEKAYENIGIHLPGRHQMLNAACALTCITVLKELGFGIDDSAVRSGMDTTVWPGRLEMIREKPAVILDGAHNPSGAQTLADAVRLYFPGKKIHLILGVFRDKDVDGVVKILCSVAAEVTATMSDGPRATNASELAEIVRKYHSRVEIRPDLREAITAVMGRLAEEGTDDDILVISGSLHLIGEARTILLENLYGWSQWNH